MEFPAKGMLVMLQYNIWPGGFHPRDAVLSGLMRAPIRLRGPNLADQRASDMTEQTARAVCVGEALIALTRGADGKFALSCGGDTFNTAVYLARAGIDVAFATAVGDDPYSDSIVALAAAEGVATNLVLRVPGRLPALCMV